MAPTVAGQDPLTGGPATEIGECVMALGDKASNKAEELKGGAKETAGKVTGDKDLEAEGKSDQVKGNLKQAGEKIKDVFKH